MNVTILDMLDWMLRVGIRMIVVGTQSGNSSMRKQGCLIVGTLLALPDEVA